MVRVFCFAILLAVASVRCAGNDATPDAVEAFEVLDDAIVSADAAEVRDAGPDAIAMPVAVCGLPAHTWLPSDGMGTVVAVEPLPQYSFKKEVLAALAGQTGYGDVLEPSYDIKVMRVRYVTQDHGVLREATAAVAYPVLDEGQTLTAPVAVALHGTSGFIDACAPSRGQDGALVVAVFATQGLIAVAPDYLGQASFGEPSVMPHPYLVAEPTAIASWDAARAAIRLAAEQAPGVTVDPRALLFGGSQGGHAVLFVDRYGPTYAPELPVLASVALTAPADLVGEARRAVGAFGPPTEAFAAAVISLARWYGLDDRLTEVLRDDEPLRFLTNAKAMMDSDACRLHLDQVGATTVADVFQPAFVAAVQAGTWAGFEDWRCLLAENSLTTTSVPRANDDPMITVLSGADELVDLATEQAAHVTLCEQGYELTEITCIGAAHTRGPAWAVREVFGWLNARLAGEPLGATCQHPDPVCCQGSPAEVCVP